MKEIIILIPPSEGKNEGGSSEKYKVKNDLVKNMISKLSSFKEDWEKILCVKGNALDKAISNNKNILFSPILPSIERYSGVVYKGIDYDSLKEKKFFDKHVRIVSPVFGLLKPDDKIPNYKLKMDKLDAINNWKDSFKESLKGKFVIDLLPQVFRKAVSYEEGIEVDFFLYKNGKKVNAGHNGKLIKGKFVRFLCENKVKNISLFSKFKEDGWKFEDGVFFKRV